jgi:ABC-type nickel/cobalt efflux system permease component RcnA
VVFAIALLLGLRHAADPDHLVAVTTLVAGARSGGARAAARLGAAWGAGHALTLLVFGLPIVLAGLTLPEPLERLAEAAIGVLIVGLAVQLLRRWRRGAYHAHEHQHEGLRHAHVHGHGGALRHAHAHPPPRSPLAAFLVGCLHGMGGSAAVGLLLVGTVPSREGAAAALLVFATGTALSMAMLSGAFGLVLASRRIPWRPSAAIPALGSFSALFGVWYGLAAWSLVPYPL